MASSSGAAELEAYALIDKAAKKASSTSWFGSNQTKFEEASDMYAKAGNLLKANKRWKEAGDAYTQAADLQMRLNEKTEASSKYAAAASCYKKISPEEAVVALRKSIEILVDTGRFHAAATQQKEIAEIYELDLVDLEKAIQAYEVTADWYSGENASSLANACHIKSATLAAQMKQFDKAVEKFEQVAAASVDNNLTRFSVKEYLLKAGLCQICTGDYVRSRNALERYHDMDGTFAGTRECRFLTDILSCCEEGDVQRFTDCVMDFDNMTKLDNWKTTILLHIKKSIQEEPSLT